MLLFALEGGQGVMKAVYSDGLSPKAAGPAGPVMWERGGKSLLSLVPVACLVIKINKQTELLKF